MKLKLALASLIIASSQPLFADLPAMIEGKVGSVTLALTVSVQADDKIKVLTNSDTSLKTRTIRSISSKKYNTKAFVSDMLIKYELTGKVSDWSVKYVESDAGEFSGYFLVSKTGEIKCIGGNVGYSGPIDQMSLFRIYSGPGFAALTQGTENKSVVRVGHVDISGKTETKFKTHSGAFFGLSSAPETFTALIGNATESGSDMTAYTIDSETEEETTTSASYTVGAFSMSNITSILQASEDPLMFTGSLNTSALKNTSDVSAYLVAWNALFNSDF
jgi:hypothetical protein